jgi:hypothetical protein
MAACMNVMNRGCVRSGDQANVFLLASEPFLSTCLQAT